MMQNSRFKLSALAIATAMACSPAAFATNGYFKHGYGQKAEGMGGVGVALPQDSLAEATNPAGLAFVGNRADVGMELFNPRRDATVQDLTGGEGGSINSAKSGATLFLVPEAGFSMDMAGMTMGLAMVANGGMNTRYNSNPINLSMGDPRPSTLGVNLEQLLILPSVAYKLNDSNSLGASLIVGYQRFRAYGFGNFGGFSTDANSMTNKGDDDSWGGGVRLGWTGKLTDSLTLGATAASKVYMQPFSKYKGLFAQKGDFDIPANYAVGMAFKPSNDLTLAFDVERILYSGVKAIHDTGPTPTEFQFGPSSPDRMFGASNGMGYGWESITVYKLGASYNLNDQWTLRGGVNYGKSPIPDDQTLLNVTAPGVVEKHLTFGFTYNVSKNNELTVSAMHAFRKDQSGPFADIGMSENSVGAGYAWKF